MRDESHREAGDNPDHGGGILTAVRAWDDDPAAAKAKYGPIASWDTSDITDVHALFYDKEDFNEDISRSNVSNVVRMNCMLYGATSFTGDLSCWEVGQVESHEQYVRGRHLVQPPAWRGVGHQHGQEGLHVQPKPRHHRGEDETPQWHHRVNE